MTLEQLRRAYRWLDRYLWAMLGVNAVLVVLRLWQRDISFLASLAGLCICCLGLLRGRNRRAAADERDRLSA